jgi:prevent-host-death family protein
MRQLSATEASRNFAEVLDGVESRGESFLVVRHGRAVATIRPTSAESGKALKEVLRSHRPDDDWAAEVRELRDSLEPVSDPWRD